MFDLSIKRRKKILESDLQLLLECVEATKEELRLVNTLYELKYGTKVLHKTEVVNSKKRKAITTVKGS